MDTTVAVAHWGQGAGHATRLLGAATRLRDTGCRVVVGGGGPGARFVKMNGFDEFQPTQVSYLQTKQENGVSGLVKSLPRARQRLHDYQRWLRNEDADTVVTDDLYAAVAGRREDVSVFMLDHMFPGMFDDPINRFISHLTHGYGKRYGETMFHTSTVWDRLDHDGYTHVPPLAHDDTSYVDHDVDDNDVLLLPSVYSQDFDAIAAGLSDQRVCHVGGPDWTPIASVAPLVAAADVVVCSGFSSIADAVAGGTPCVILPVTPEQHAVADRIDEADVDGFAVVHSPEEAIAAARDPPKPAPRQENGADAVAAHVLKRLG